MAISQNVAANEINREEIFARFLPGTFSVFHDEINTKADIDNVENNSETNGYSPTSTNEKRKISELNKRTFVYALYLHYLTEPNKKATSFISKTIGSKLFLEEKTTSNYLVNLYKPKRKISIATHSQHTINVQLNGYIQSNIRVRGNNVGLVSHPSAKNLLQFNNSFTMLSGKVHQQQYLPYFPAGKFVAELKLEKKSFVSLHHPSFSLCMRNYFSQMQSTISQVPQRGYTLFDLCMGSDINILHLQIHTSFFCTNLFGTDYFNHLAIKRGLGVYDGGRNTGVMVQVNLTR